MYFFFQRNLLYHPSVDNYLKDNFAAEPSEIEKVKITTDDKLDLIGWFYNKDIKKFKTILFFHGNAGSLNNRTYKLNYFKELDVNYLIIAWRGFNGNMGKPNEIGLYEDARSAVRWLNKKGIQDKNIILYGESLGTAVSLEIAQNKKNDIYNQVKVDILKKIDSKKSDESVSNLDSLILAVDKRIESGLENGKK